MKQSVLKKEILLSASAQDIYLALTTSKSILQYYPLDEVISDWKKGLPIVFKGTHEGQPFMDRGTIDQLDQDQVFQYTYWSTNHGTEDLPENYQTIRYQITPQEQNTKLELTHSNLHNEEALKLMDQVWDFLLGSLKNFIEKT